VSVLAVQNVPDPFEGERVLADDVPGELGENDRHRLGEDRAEQAGRSLVGGYLDVRAGDAIGAAARTATGQLGVDVEHLELPLLRRLDRRRTRDLKAAHLRDLHPTSSCARLSSSSTAMRHASG